MDKSTFKHVTHIRVRNYEVDWQGIVHNATYLLYCEIGRVEYLKHLGIELDLNSIGNENRVVLVRNEIDYRSPSYFDEVLEIYSRIASIKDTSFIFEALIEEAKNKRPICENIAVHVWLDPVSGEPKSVSDEFRLKVKDFEGIHLKL